MENTRDSIVTNLRPTLKLPEATSQVEAFQNDVLRPLLKFQNQWLLCEARFYLKKRHRSFNALNVSAQKQVIRQAGKQDPELRNALVHSVSSLFTAEEHAFYHLHRPELNRRISEMGVQRLLSQLDLLY